MAEWQTTNAFDVVVANELHDIGYGVADTQFGTAAIAWTDTRICWFAPNADGDAAAALTHHWAPVRLTRNDKLAAEHAAALIARPGQMPLLLRGTPWQIQIWQALRTIPVGHTLSYADLAERAGCDRRCARAVGSAVGANHIAVGVPCHRVLPASGGLGGFRWGESLKQWLLTHEKPPGGDSVVHVA